jgi:transcriptional regulator with GAF, ATPase, and Fis domain
MNRHIEVISEDTMTALVRYAWPGNIRELRNFIERAVIVTKGPVLEGPVSCLEASIEAVCKPTTLHEAECDHILGTLRETGWIVGGNRGAAARLGLKRTTLISKMQRLGLSRPCNTPIGVVRES